MGFRRIEMTPRDQLNSCFAISSKPFTHFPACNLCCLQILFIPLTSCELPGIAAAIWCPWSESITTQGIYGNCSPKHLERRTKPEKAAVELWAVNTLMAAAHVEHNCPLAPIYFYGKWQILCANDWRNKPPLTHFLSYHFSQMSVLKLCKHFSTTVRGKSAVVCIALNHII